MISTENNNALEEVQKEKLEIQELNTKFKNFDNDPEFKESLVEVLISNVATDHNIVEFYDYYKLEVTKYKGLCREFLEKSRSMDDDTKDLFWFLIVSLVRLVHTMYKDKLENHLIKSQKFKLLFGKYFRFVISHISFSDCGGDEETRAKLKERFLSDPNLKEFLSGELEAYTTTLLDTNWNKLYPWSS